jgi:hypothetical protein
MPAASAKRIPTMGYVIVSFMRIRHPTLPTEGRSSTMGVVVFDMGVTGFDGAVKRRLQAEHRNLLKLAKQTITANTTTATYAFAAPSYN